MLRTVRWPRLFGGSQNFPLSMFRSPLRDFIDVVWKIWEDKREISWETFATTAWCIWKNRNSIKFEGWCKVVKAITKEAELLVEEFS